MSDVLRKIHFYQVVWVKNNGGRIQKNSKFIQSILSKISGQLIQQNNEELLYLESYKQDSLGNSNKSLYRISKIRKNDLPLGFDIDKKNIFPLHLEDNQAISEPSHFVIFDGKIIGAEYNYYGVKWVNSKLMWLINGYLKSNSYEDVKRVEIKPILKKEIYDLIEKFIEIKGIRISIATNYAKLLTQEDPQSFEQMFSAAELVDNMWLHLSFTLGKGRRYGDPTKFEKIIKSVKKILSREDSKNNVNVLEIRGRFKGGETIESINVLEELMLTEKRIPKLDERTRAVKSNSMYREIIESYFILKEELEEFMNPVNVESDSS